MPALTIKNIPDDLYIRLKEAARARRRSLNSEILYCVERTLVLQMIVSLLHLPGTWVYRLSLRIKGFCRNSPKSQNLLILLLSKQYGVTGFTAEFLTVNACC
jgi:hypothetical protein